MHVKNGCSYSAFQCSFDWKWELTVDTRTADASVLIAVDRRTKLIARCIDRLIDAPCFWNIAGFIIPHLCLAPPQGVTRRNFANIFDTHKTRMNGLSCGEESMTICFQPFWYNTSVWRMDRRTDGQTDGRTDVKPIAITCFSIADARKNSM